MMLLLMKSVFYTENKGKEKTWEVYQGADTVKFLRIPSVQLDW